MTTYDTPEAIAITDKAARDLLDVEKLKAINSELPEALQAAEELYRVGLLGSAIGQIARVNTLRKAAIAKALGDQA